MSRPVTVVEVPPFPAHADAVWSDDERTEFIDFIARNPLAGEEVPGTGGLRTVYAKGWQKDLSPDEKKILSAFARAVKAKMKSQR